MYHCVLFDLDDTLVNVPIGSGHSRSGRATLLCPSTIGILKELSERCALGIVTSSPMPHAIRSLRETGLLPFFQGNVVACECVRRRKPDPAPVLLAMQRLKAIPEQTVLIGDGEADMEAAEAAGIQFLLAGWSLKAQKTFADTPTKKCTILARLEELPRLCFPGMVQL